MIKASQVTHSQASEIAGEASLQEDVNAVKHKPKPQKESEKRKIPKSSTGNPWSNSKLKECLFCGGKHALDRKLCPASGQTCKKCDKVGHFAVKCRSKSVNVNANDVEEVFYINNIGGKDQALVPVALNDTVSVTFQIYSGTPAARRAAKRSPIGITGKKSKPMKGFFSWFSWLAVLLVGAYARRRRRRSRARWRP